MDICHNVVINFECKNAMNGFANTSNVNIRYIYGPQQQ